ncbi:MAG: hypothetical protein LBJ73_01170 [Rickettsiales bacterium]|jgi:hypothetical protein|nr:hypothetical protein [Rickettsiales bacterium]
MNYKYKVHTGEYCYEPDLVGAIDYGLYQGAPEIPSFSGVKTAAGGFISLTKRKLEYQIGEHVAVVSTYFNQGAAVIGSSGRLHRFGLYNKFPRTWKKQIKKDMIFALKLEKGITK